MYIFFFITVAILLIYGNLIFYYQSAWKDIPEFTPANFDGWEGTTKVSVIIPARNEEINIGNCLDSLAMQTYPKHLLEIIVVNDHSTDKTEENVKAYPAPNVKLINLRDHVRDNTINAYKKKALEVAIKEATGELIVTTDADCTAPPDWIKCLAAFHKEYKAAFIAAPVKIETTHSLLSIFQSMDFMTLQGITGAAVHKEFHSMCNGANLAYEKMVFNEVDGFKGIDDIASGDDMLLMHKIFLKHPKRVFFLKSAAAIVCTQPAATVKEFIQQRIRWASKADKYQDKRIFAVLLLVYILNVFLLVFFIGGLWNKTWFVLFLVILVGKIIVEFAFVRKLAAFFNQQSLIVYFPFLQPLHILYTVIVGWLGKFGSYEWKSRKVK